MKRTVLAVFAVSMAMCSFAQTDTTTNEKADTIKIGGMIIIKKGDKSDSSDTGKNITISDGKKTNVTLSNRKKNKPSNVTTNWWVVDLGFANLNDNTDYTSAAAQSIAPGSTKDQFSLRTGKSVNVNVWLFMQRLNLVKHYINLKYGLGVELNNYRFENETIRFQKNPTLIVLDASLKDVNKNKLAADYVTVPIMLNINLTPGRNKGFGFSGGISGGYLYSARQKFKMGNDDKSKTHGNFDLEKWKLSYIGELNLGPVKLYGSYATKSMWERGLDQTPYNLGIRFGN